MNPGKHSVGCVTASLGAADFRLATGRRGSLCSHACERLLNDACEGGRRYVQLGSPSQRYRMMDMEYGESSTAAATSDGVPEENHCILPNVRFTDHTVVADSYCRCRESQDDCSGENLTDVPKLSTDQVCIWCPEASKFIIAMLVIVILLVALVTTLHRYRWHIRLVLFEAFRDRAVRLHRLQGQRFRYDVFICYDHDDLDWVRRHLMPELEGKMGLRLCIHQRDFIVGNPVADNIMESIQDSKKVMMLFSKNFARSEWCQFELRLSLSHVMENDDTLLVVLLEDIRSRDLTPTMMAVMKTMTYIEWEDEREARASFWRRMRLALTEILSLRDKEE